MIWKTRPQICHDFLCAWAQGIAPEALKPSVCKVVLTWTTDGKYPVAHVDPSRPNAWREGEVGKYLDTMAQHLGRVYIIIGKQRKFVGWDPPPQLRKKLEGLLQ